MATAPVLDFSRAYTNEERMSTADNYRKALEDYYKTINPTQYYTKGELAALNPTAYAALSKKQRKQPSTAVKYKPWEKSLLGDVNYQMGSSGLLSQYQSQYKPTKSVGTSPSARRSALTDYITGRVY